MCNLHQIIGPSLVDVATFSKWEKLHRTMAYTHRFIRRSQRNDERILGALTQDELVVADRSLWIQTQAESFALELQQLEKTKGRPYDIYGTLSKSSKIYKLYPSMDETGVMRKRSRLVNVDWIPYPNNIE